MLYEVGGRDAWDAGDVAALRERLGLSQEELARMLGVRQQTVSDWETGRHEPRGASLRVLSMASRLTPVEQPARAAAKPGARYGAGRRADV
jgi:transcriptional regulator with XRE-family HTH domain